MFIQGHGIQPFYTEIMMTKIIVITIIIIIMMMMMMMMMIDTDFENNLRRKNSVNIELKT